LIDEVDPEKELQEIAEAIAEPAKFPSYVRDKSAKAVSKFLVSYALTDIVVCHL